MVGARSNDPQREIARSFVTRRLVVWRPHQRVRILLAATSRIVACDLVGAELFDPAKAPSARSWARIEDGEVVMVALRGAEAQRARCPGVASASTKVLVAAGAGDLASAALVRIVPFGDGDVELRRAIDAPVVALLHLLSGAHAPGKALQGPGRVRLQVSRVHDGDPVEHVELRFG